MLTNISTKQEVLEFFIQWIDKHYSVYDDDDQLVKDLIIAKADDMISDDVDYWANESMRKLFNNAKDSLMNGNI